MSHLEDKLAEFVFDELSSQEMEVARQHVTQCLECQGRVSDFRKVQHSLEQLPDVDLPRRIVFVPETAPTGRTRGWFSLAWAVPSAAAVAVVIGLLIAGPFQFEWDDAGMQVAFGSLEPEQIVGPVAITTAPIDYESLDYERIARLLQPDQQVWLTAEFEQQSSQIDRVIESSNDTNRQEIRRIRADMGLLYEMNLAVTEDYWEQGATLQQIAQRTGGLE